MTDTKTADPTKHQPLWEPVTLGALRLPHRLAMAPMTRSRATEHGEPTELTAAYYGQRASLAMVVTEGVQPSADGQGYWRTPGVHTDAQVEAWRPVADRVHAGGAPLVIQLMHVGRVSHVSNTPHGRPPKAPSAVAAQADMFTPTGPEPMSLPEEMTLADIQQATDDFRTAARRAIEAGADGVELHGANGYLLHQFLSSNANLRTDGYGGDLAGRIRLAVEVATAVADEIGADRVGFRISPGNPLNDITEDDAPELYAALATELRRLDLAYLHLLHLGDEDLLRRLRGIWTDRLVVNRAGADLDARVQDVEAGLADVVTVGAMALANPDLVERVRTGAALNDPDPATFYGGADQGYTDYPTLSQS